MAQHGNAHYVKIWAILLGLLVASVLGPLLGHPIVTLVTAFGIAIVKAFLVAKNFMHLNIEKRIVGLILAVMLVLMALMVGGVAPDVMQHQGLNWENTSAKETVKAGQAHGEKAHH
jgi:caa(3)-type oxidase subunit IV